MRACGSRCLSSVIFVRLKESVVRSAMSHPCWSVPHLLTSSPSQHAALPGPRDLLRDDTAHQQPLPQELLPPLPESTLSECNARSESSAEKSLSHIYYESARNLRPNTPAGYEPKELTTIPMMSPEEDVYQLYDVQIDFGEQEKQAPLTEEVKEFGQLQAQSSLDHEMAEMSPVEKMSYLQSQMHFDESMESIADSDIEDGELQKLLTSSLYAQRASGKPDAMVVQ